MNTHFTATAKDWLAALNFIAPAIKHRPVKPVLSSVYIQPSTGTLTGSDFEVHAVAAVANADSSGFHFLADYRSLVDAIKATTTGDRSALVEVTPHTEDGGRFIVIKAAGYSLSLPADDVSEYPEQDLQKVTHKIQVKGRNLKAAIARVEKSASKDDTLPVLNAIKFSHEGGILHLTATDRYRMTTDSAPTTSRTKTPYDFLVKAKLAANIARRTLANDDVDIELLNGDTASFRLPGGMISTLLVNGEFPKIASLFAFEVLGRFDADRLALVQAARVALDMSERGSPSRLAFTDQGVRLHFNEGLFDGSVSPLVKGELIHDNPESHVTAFNPRYLLEALVSLESDKVRFHYRESSKSVLLTESVETPHKHALMPVRIPTSWAAL